MVSISSLVMSSDTDVKGLLGALLNQLISSNETWKPIEPPELSTEFCTVRSGSYPVQHIQPMFMNPQQTFNPNLGARTVFYTTYDNHDL